MFLAVTTQAVRVRILSRHGLETYDLAYVSAALDVCGAGTMAGLATVSVLQGGLEVGSPFKLVRVQILVACLAGIAANIFCRLILRRSAFLFLVIGCESKRNQKQACHCRLTWRPLFPSFFLFQSWTPRAQERP